MYTKNIKDIIPNQGFLKIDSQKVEGLSSKDRILLIRRGNEFFNNGDIDKAKRIFLTTGYSDGMIRLGDYYLKRNCPLEAYRMYWLAPAPDKIEELSINFAGVIKKWLKD